MFKKFLIFLFVATSLLTTTSPTLAQWTTGVDGCVYNDVVTIKGIECLVQRLLGIIIPLILVAILLMLVFGAYQIMFSRGDAKAVEGGKSTITNAILGLVLAILAYFIIALIAYTLGVKEILEFTIGIVAPTN